MVVILYYCYSMQRDASEVPNACTLRLRFCYLYNNFKIAMFKKLYQILR